MNLSIHPRWLAVTAVATFVVACTGTTPPTTSPSGATGGSAAPTGGSTNASVAENRAKVCEEGAKEGKLVFWHYMAHGADVFRAFNEKYPDIQIEEKFALSDDNAQALLTEISAGRQPSADLMYGEPSVLQPIFDAKGADESIDWKSLGIPDDYLLGEHAAVRLYRISLGLLFNSANYTEATLPASWDEVLDPKWKGKVVVDPRGRPFDFISLLWGHDKTIDYVKKLKALDPQVIKGGAVGGEAVVNGSAAFSAGGRTDDLGDFQATGAPVGLKYLEVIPTLDTYNIVPTGAQHPNAAKCLVAWLAAEGQAVHDEAEHKSNSSDPPEGAPANATFVSPKNPQEAQAVATIGAEIGGIFTGTGN